MYILHEEQSSLTELGKTIAHLLGRRPKWNGTSPIRTGSEWKTKTAFSEVTVFGIETDFDDLARISL